MSAIRISFVVMASLLSLPCFGWLQVTAPQNDEAFFLYGRGNEVWAVNKQIQFKRIDFLLGNSDPSHPPFRVDAAEFQNFMEKEASAEQAAGLMAKLRERDKTHIAGSDPSGKKVSDLDLVVAAVEHEGEAWLEATEVQEDEGEASPVTEPAVKENPAVTSQQEEQALRALQQGAYKARTSATVAPYPGPESEMRELELDRLEEKRRQLEAFERRQLELYGDTYKPGGYNSLYGRPSFGPNFPEPGSIRDHNGNYISPDRAYQYNANGVLKPQFRKYGALNAFGLFSR